MKNENSSNIVGHSIRDIHFRSRFKAAVVAVKRLKQEEGLLGKFKKPRKEQVPGKLGEIVLQPGDELYLDLGEC
jgi:Trk K+ transport system NAD-binding subunit